MKRTLLSQVHIISPGEYEIEDMDKLEFYYDCIKNSVKVPPIIVASNKNHSLPKIYEDCREKAVNEALNEFRKNTETVFFLGMQKDKDETTLDDQLSKVAVNLKTAFVENKDKFSKVYDGLCLAYSTMPNGYANARFLFDGTHRAVAYSLHKKKIPAFEITDESDLCEIRRFYARNDSIRMPSFFNKDSLDLNIIFNELYSFMSRKPEFIMTLDERVKRLVEECDLSDRLLGEIYGGDK